MYKPLLGTRSFPTFVSNSFPISASLFTSVIDIVVFSCSIQLIDGVSDDQYVIKSISVSKRESFWIKTDSYQDME